MDFLTHTEITTLKHEVNGANLMIDAQKEAYKRELENGLGREIEEALGKIEKPIETSGEGWELI